MEEIQETALRAVITALAEESKAKVLAAPHILVSDNREARIQVGRQVPIATSTTSTLTSTTSTDTSSSIPVTSTIQYKDIGIILKVKPQVNDSGLIALEITQEISSLGETVKVGGQDEIVYQQDRGGHKPCSAGRRHDYYRRPYTGRHFKIKGWSSPSSAKYLL